MELKTTDYCLLESTTSIEDFLKLQFSASGNKIKKHFAKKFLNRSLNAKSVLTLPLNFINDGLINPTYIGLPVEIIAEDENFFVFTKNPNQFVHPLTYDESDNCLSYLRQVRPELLEVNKESYDRGLLYRVDYETSGVMIYVKNDEFYHKLRDNFSSVAKEKIYWCWVQGEMTLQGEYKHAFNSSEEKGKRVKVSDAVGVGQTGEFAIRPLEFDSAIMRTLVEVKLKTGLRHQIRAQMAYLGFPLVGDTFYGGPEAKRLYLHALTYGLEIDGLEYFWESKPLNFSGL
jgi:23S rRNA pseudouridine1911/1915/1917 synthase